MEDAEFLKLLSWAYRGEVSGAILFAGLAERCTGWGRSAQLETLAELERTMGDALVPLVEAHGASRGDGARTRRDAEAGVEMFSGQSWETFLDQFEPTTTDALERYQRLAALAPTGDLPTLQLLIEHEEALREFGRQEQAGNPAGALDRVQRVLADLRRHLTPDLPSPSTGHA
jgi:hypothetical protein